MKMAEATILVPMTILIIASIISLMMRFYGDLDTQIEKHVCERKSTNKKSRRNLTSFQTEIDASQRGRQVTSAKEKEDTLAIQQ